MTSIMEATAFHNGGRMAYTVVLDPGHGGSDPGAVFEGRQEKDDSLKLAMAVGDILRDNGYNVVFTRTTDVYNTPFEKATIGNESYGDLFVSIHRNSAPETNMYSGIQTLLYNDSGIKAELARNINRNLVELGFEDKGVVERPNLVVLKRTRMPAVLVEAGFINSEYDNRIFDEQFNQVAQAIADGIMETVGRTQQASTAYVNNSENREYNLQSDTTENSSGMWNNMTQSGPIDIPSNIQQNISSMNPPISPKPPMVGGMQREYTVQTGAYRNRYLANNLAYQLLSMGYPAKVVFENELYKVQVGNFERLDNASMMESRLREDGFNTFIKGLR